MISENKNGSASIGFPHPGRYNVIDIFHNVDLRTIKKTGTSLSVIKKAIALMQELVIRFTSSRNDQVCDLFDGSLVTALSCLTVPNGANRRFLGCEKRPLEVARIKPFLCAAFAKFVCTPAVSLTTDSKIVSCAETVLKFTLASFRENLGLKRETRKMKECWALPDHVTCFLATLWDRRTENFSGLAISD